MRIGFVTARLALSGAVESLYDARHLASAGVSHVLSLRSPKNHPGDVASEAGWCSQAGVAFANNPRGGDEDKTPEWFDASWKHALAVLGGRAQNKLLIHCREGLHRGPATVYFLGRAIGLSRTAAWRAVLDAAADAEADYQREAEAALAALGFTDRNRRT